MYTFLRNLITFIVSVENDDHCCKASFVCRDLSATVDKHAV